jgi:hypothetical protein
MREIEISIQLRRRTNADKGHLRGGHGFGRFTGRPQPSVSHRRSDALANIFLDDRRDAPIDEIHLYRVWVDADDLVSICCQATRRNGTDVAQAEDANAH